LKAVGHPASSREIVDKLDIQDKEYGRALVRRTMGVLAEKEKVKIEKKGKSYVYSLP
jgi:predicted transcriptional regulator